MLGAITWVLAILDEIAREAAEAEAEATGEVAEVALADLPGEP